MGWNNWSDEPTTEFTDSELEEHDEEIRADERKNTLNDFRKRLIEETDKGFCLTMALVDEIIEDLNTLNK